MESGWWAGLGALATGVIGAVATAAVMMMRAREREKRMGANLEAKIRASVQKERRETRRDIDLQKTEHIDRLSEQVVRDGKLINKLYEAVSECHSSAGELYGHLSAMYGHIAMMNDFARNLGKILRELGHDVPEIPASPEMPDRPKRLSVLDDFEVRTTEQSGMLAEKVTEAIKKKPPPIPGS